MLQKKKKVLMGLLSLALLLGNFFGFQTLTAEAYLQNDTEQDELRWEVLEVLNIVNRERMNEGLHPLAMHINLAEGAQIRAAELILSQTHGRPDGREWLTVLPAVGIPNPGWHGENVAWGQTTPHAVMIGTTWSWMGSPGHRANIMNQRYQYIGVGHHHDASARWSNYWTQLFMSGPQINGIRVYDGNFTIPVGGTIEDSGAWLWMNTADGSRAFMPILNGMISGLDSDVLGNQMITVYYQDFATTFEVTVVHQDYPAAQARVVEPAHVEPQPQQPDEMPEARVVEPEMEIVEFRAEPEPEVVEFHAEPEPQVEEVHLEPQGQIAEMHVEPLQFNAANDQVFFNDDVPENGTHWWWWNFDGDIWPLAGGEMRPFVRGEWWPFVEEWWPDEAGWWRFCW